MKRKYLAIVIILLFGGTIIIPSTINANHSDRYEQNLCQKECLIVQENITVTFMYPENGIYWNYHKIVPFSVPLILYGYGILLGHGVILTPVQFKIDHLEYISEIEVYINDILMETWIGPPFYDNVGLPMTRFSTATAKVVAYTDQGDYASDEITVWRLFL